MIYASQLFSEIDEQWIFKKDFNRESPVYEWLPCIAMALIRFFSEKNDEERTKSFVANSNKVSTDFYDYVRKKVPLISSCEYMFDPAHNYSVNSDFTIVLGER